MCWSSKVLPACQVAPDMPSSLIAGQNLEVQVVVNIIKIPKG